jgi:hypothetical protein
MSPANGEYPDNPNGSIEDIAGITSEDGKVLGLQIIKVPFRSSFFVIKTFFSFLT